MRLSECTFLHAEEDPCARYFTSEYLKQWVIESLQDSLTITDIYKDTTEPMGIIARLPNISSANGGPVAGGVCAGLKDVMELKIVCTVLGGSTAPEYGARIAHQFSEHVAYASSAPPPKVMSLNQ
jgi:hypothetical protein